MNNLEGRKGRLHNETAQDSNDLCFNRYGYFQGSFVAVLCPQFFFFLFSELQHTEDFRSSLNFQKYGLGQENPTQNFQKHDQGQDRKILPRNPSLKLLPELQETHTQMETLKISTILRKVIGNKSKQSCISSEQLCACLIGKGFIMLDLSQNYVLIKFYVKKLLKKCAFHCYMLGLVDKVSQNNSVLSWRALRVSISLEKC